MTSIFAVICIIEILGSQVFAAEFKIGIFLENAQDKERLAIESTRQFLMSTRNTELNTSFVVRESTSKNGMAAALQVCEMLREGISGLVSMSSCDTLKFLQSQQRLFQIPHLAISPGHCLSEKHGKGGFTLYMRENGAYTVQAVIDMVTHLSWKDLALIYDESYVPSHLSALLFNLSSHFIQSIVVSVTDQNRTRDVYYQDKMTGLAKRSAPPSNFLLLLSPEKVTKVLNVASQMGLLSQKSYWVIVSDDISDCFIEGLNVNDSNIFVIKKTWHKTACTEALPKFILRTMSTLKLSEAYLIDAMVALMNTAKVTGATTEKAKMIDCQVQPLQQWKHGIPLMEIIKQTDAFGLTGRLSFDSDGYNNNTNYDVFTVDPRDLAPKLVTVAHWDKGKGLQIEGDLFPYSGGGFGNITFRVGTKEALPFVVKMTDSSGPGFKGFCIDILDELALRLNFRYEFTEPSDGQWGSEEPGGTFNGIVGMVIGKELDFGVGPISINAEREKGIDFTKPFLEDGIGIIMKKPTEDSDRIYRMFRPFSGTVWATLAASVIAIGVGLYIVSKISPFSEDNERPPAATEPSQKDNSLKENVWLIFASLMEQGGENLPTAVSGRVILGFWWLFTILIVSSYTANLAAFLTVTIEEKPIKNLEELASQTEIKPLVKTGTNVYSLFRVSSQRSRTKSGGNDVYKRIWDQIKSGPQLTENAAAYDLVKTGQYAFMTDKAQLEYLVKKECETYVLADESFNNAGFGFVFPENSPYLEEFSFNIIKMQEAGLIERWRVKWWPTSDSCSSSGPTSEAKSLGLDSTGGPFFIFILATCASFLCLMFEVAYSRFRYKKLVLQTIVNGSKMSNKLQ